ncbi:hypothetical protein C8J57DRAFT_1246772 [Mycena rebaudengoi]|nr:hypothetical protein C8J57DRAFT_1246772 [Mycena rebaudengoi]
MSRGNSARSQPLENIVLQNRAMWFRLIPGLGRRGENAFYQTKTELESILSRVFCATQSGRKFLHGARFTLRRTECRGFQADCETGTWPDATSEADDGGWPTDLQIESMDGPHTRFKQEEPKRMDGGEYEKWEQALTIQKSTFPWKSESEVLVQ